MLYRLVVKQDSNGQIVLTPEQQHYLKKVLRMGSGDRFIALDGRGKSWIARIKGTSAEIVEPLNLSTELPITATLVIALPKGNAFDEVVRCTTELGVTTIVPVISDRTIIKPSPHKLERWRRIATEAAEQSERQIVPNITEPVKFVTALADLVNLETDCYICVARSDGRSLFDCLQNKQARNTVIATGPEGGFSPKEIETAKAAGFQAVSLGRRILRAVTAPIAALSLLAAIAQTNNQNS